MIWLPGRRSSNSGIRITGDETCQMHPVFKKVAASFALVRGVDVRDKAAFDNPIIAWWKEQHFHERYKPFLLSSPPPLSVPLTDAEVLRAVLFIRSVRFRRSVDLAMMSEHQITRTPLMIILVIVLLMVLSLGLAYELNLMPLDLEWAIRICIALPILAPFFSLKSHIETLTSLKRRLRIPAAWILIIYGIITLVLLAFSDPLVYLIIERLSIYLWADMWFISGSVLVSFFLMRSVMYLGSVLSALALLGVVHEMRESA